MFNLIEEELKKREELSKTENGAIGYKSSGSALVDLNFAVSSLRSASEEEIELMFDQAFYEDREYTLKWLFFARDIREGLGERRLFRICYNRLLKLSPVDFFNNLKNISEYGRWDDLVSLIGIDDIADKYIVEIILNQLNEDIVNMKKDLPISLLAKWLPSENASSKKTKALARKIIFLFGIKPKVYRKTLSLLRKYLKVTEVYMCNKDWGNIDYEKVPSLANLKYKNAFLRNDPKRRSKYLDSLERGEVKINMKAANPVDVVSKYTDFYRSIKEYDQTLELAWKNLKDISISDTLVVADGSGSMTVSVSNSTTALDVANALAIYTSEHNSGVYKDKYITFSSTPQFVDLSSAESLMDKLIIANKHAEMTNTNIEAVFKLILDLAIENDVPKDEMIKNILIISDMEFDRAHCITSYDTYGSSLSQALFDKIRDDYEQAGYNLPKLIFWNVYSRNRVVPIRENELGIGLVSGFSQNVLKMVMSNKYNPYSVLIDILDSERYDQIVL